MKRVRKWMNKAVNAIFGLTVLNVKSEEQSSQVCLGHLLFICQHIR